jgi:flagellar protein FliS
MPTMRRAIDAYGQASETLAPAQQIVLLYEGAIRRIREARHAIEARRINDRCLAVRKATAIIEGLQGCLDHARGGEIARNLDRIYAHVIFRLQRINLRRGDRAPRSAARRLGPARGGRGAGGRETCQAARPGARGDHLSCADPA